VADTPVLLGSVLLLPCALLLLLPLQLLALLLQLLTAQLTFPRILLQ
jgi:hypothetical protein